MKALMISLLLVVLAGCSSAAVTVRDSGVSNEANKGERCVVKVDKNYIGEFVYESDSCTVHIGNTQ